MKKFLILLLTAVLALTIVGCSGSNPTKTTVWKYESLTYEVSELGSETKGTLTMTAEQLISDVEYTIPQIKEDGTLDLDFKVNLPSGSHVLEGLMEFGEDVIFYQTVTTSDFFPLYSYKTMLIGAEQKAYEGTEQNPVCTSYVMTTSYDKAGKTASSAFLRRKTYGEADWDGTFSADNWTYFSKIYTEVGNEHYDVNQLYYVIRCMDNLTQDDFSYTCYVPLVLEVDEKVLYASSEPEYSLDLSQIPYFAENYDANFSLYTTKTTITPQNTNVSGKGINVYYAESPIYSREQIASGASGSVVGLIKVPVMMQENVAISNSTNSNGRGTITYKLKDVSNVRP